MAGLDLNQKECQVNQLSRLARTCILVPFLLAGCFSGKTPWHKVERFTNKAKDKIVNRFYGGGTHITIQSKSYNYNAYTGAFRIEARLTWRGLSSKRSDYWSEGVLVVKDRGNMVTWCAESMSHNLQSYLSTLEMANGEVGRTVVVFITGKAIRRDASDP